MTSLRAQKKRATARSLADAAYTLAVDHGFEAVTTDDITSQAGVSRRTFANYFSGKQAAVVDGFMQSLGVSTWHPDDRVDFDEIPNTFNEFITFTHVFIADIFKNNDHIVQIQTFAKMVDEHKSLEPYVHAVFLEFRHSSSHAILSERFGQARVSMFLGAVIGSLGGIIELILGPLAIPRDTPALRRTTQKLPKNSTTPSSDPTGAQPDVDLVLARIDATFSFLRHGFADPA